jgi:hypothetical protein
VPASPLEVVAMMCQRHAIARPLTNPSAEPMPLGPLHEPEIALPLCRNTQTGALVATTTPPPRSVPETAHVPAKFAASAGAVADATRANAASALA